MNYSRHPSTAFCSEYWFKIAV